MSTVLIVDSNTDNAHDISRNILRFCNATVFIIGVAEDAAEIILAEGIDLVISDTMIPFRRENSDKQFIPGSIIIEALAGTSIPLILIPSWEIPNTDEVNLVGIFPKPFDRTAIITRIIEVLKESQPT